MGRIQRFLMKLSAVHRVVLTFITLSWMTARNKNRQSNSARLSRKQLALKLLLLILVGGMIEYVQIPTALARAPAIPSNLAHSNVAKTGWTETWTGGLANAGYTITGYNIYLNGKKLTSVGPTSTSYTFTGMTPGTTYSVTVSMSGNGGGASFTTSQSSADSVTTLSQVTDFAVTTKSSTTGTFSWSAPIGATSIKIEQSPTGANTWTTAPTGTIDPTATTATVTGLSPGTTYDFKLVVTGGAFAGDSNTVSMTSLSSDATLGGLSLSSGTLSPTFASGTTSYTENVSNSTSSITVTPTVEQSNATVTVNGTTVRSGSASGDIALNVGSNTINVVVTAQDGTTTKTYTIDVARAGLVNAASPSISTQPQGTTVNEGATSPSLSVTASVSDSGTLSYQWYSNTTNSTSGGTAINGATSASYSVPTTSAGTAYYYVVVTNTNSSVNGTQTATATSSIAKVVVQSSSLTLSTTKTIIPAGSTLTVEGNLYVQNGNATSPVANATITLNGPSGGSWNSGGQSTVSTVYSVYSNQQGNFSVDWSAPTEPGVYTLSAESNGHKESTSVDVTKYITGAVTTQPITSSTSSRVTNTFNNLASPQYSNSDVEIVIPAGTFSQNIPVWVTSTSDASNITPSGKQVVAAVGVNFDTTQTLQHAITLTISNPNIQEGDVVDKVTSDGSYLPATANVTTGKAIVTFTTDPNFIVVGNVGGGGGPVAPTIVQDSFTEDAQVGQKYSATVHEIGGTAPMTWSVTNGSLPSGLSLDNQGVISGTPTTPGTSTFTVQVTDGNNLSTTKQLSLTVDGTASNSGGSTTTGGTGTTTPASNPVSLTTATEQSAVVGGAVNIQLQAKGGQPPYTWSVVGTLPKGLSLNSTTGILSGTPETPGIYQVAVKVAGSQGTTSQQTITLDVLRNYEREVLWNGTPKNVSAIVLKEETSDTTYMPIWYVMQLLKPMGITSTWDGKHWHMTTSVKPNMSNIQVGSGNTGIYLNGTLVQMVNTVAQNDPSTNKPTTYMPIWYVMQMLKRVGLQSTWNGTTWTVSK